MRKLLLMASLCMIAALVLPGTAFAQDEDLDCPDLSEAEEQAVFNGVPGDPNGLDENDNGVPCEDDDTDNGSYVGVEPGTGGGDDQYGTPSAAQYQYGGETGATAPATVPAGTPTDLPDTGGVSVAAYALPALALIVAGGMFVTRMIRNS